MNEPQRDQTKLMLCQIFQRNFSNSLFWSLDNRALMRWKQAEGFSLLHCCAYVTSVSNHLIPQMLKNAEAKKVFFLPSQCIAKGNYVSSASSSSLGFDF